LEYTSWTEEAMGWEVWNGINNLPRETASAARRRRKKKQKAALRDWLVPARQVEETGPVEEMDWHESDNLSVSQLEAQQAKTIRMWKARGQALRWKERRKMKLTAEKWCEEEILSWLWVAIDRKERDSRWERQQKAARREVEWWEKEESNRSLRLENSNLEMDWTVDSGEQCTLKPEEIGRIVTNRGGGSKRRRGEFGVWRLGGKPKREIFITAGAKGLELERRRKNTAGRRRGNKYKNILNKESARLSGVSKPSMEWDDQSGLEMSSVLDVEDISMDTGVLPGDDEVCMEIDTLPVQATQITQCVHEEYLSNDTYGLSECGKTDMERSGQPVQNIIHTVHSGGEDSNNDISRVSECDIMSMEMVSNSPDALITNCNTPSKQKCLSSFFEISTDSQNKLSRAVPNTTRRKPIIKKGAFQKSYQVGFKMEKITKTFLNKPSGGVKRKIELFESLSNNIEKHTKLSRMDTET
jgi:hypothetical protein